ncbi:MAG: hypothetical protein AAF605_07420 [Myxococcota bacterium]
MDRHAEFQMLLEILKSLIDRRGGDASIVDEVYRWPALSESSTPPPKQIMPPTRPPDTLSAISVSPLLTGSID